MALNCLKQLLFIACKKMFNLSREDDKWLNKVYTQTPSSNHHHHRWQMAAVHKSLTPMCKPCAHAYGLDTIRFDWRTNRQTDKRTRILICLRHFITSRVFSKISWLLLFWYGCCWCCYDTIFSKSIAANGFERQTDRHVVCFFCTYLWALFHFSFVVVAVVLIVICLILAIICLICS